MFKHIGKMLAVGGVAVGLVAAYAPPSYASARPAVNTGPVLAQVGSDTTYWVMAGSDATPAIGQTLPPKPKKGLSDYWNTHAKVHGVALNPGGSTVVEVTPFLNAPFAGSSQTVAGDADCPAGTTYSNPANLPPGGSGAGQTALKNDATSGSPGCIDFSRSSSAASVDPNMEAFAFGIDGLDWVTFPLNVHKVTNLTPATIQAIYTCNPVTHIPYTQYWDQIPGGVGHQQIVKYAPQVKSGTYSFFKSKYLGGNDADTGCTGGPSLTTFTQEHDATGAAAPTVCPQNGNQPGDSSIGRPGALDAGASSCVETSTVVDAIDVFSSAQWTAQHAGTLNNLTGGTKLQKVNGLAPSAVNLNESPNRFFGSRYVYNILLNHDKTGVGSFEPEYAATLAFAGVDPVSGPGYICGYYFNATTGKNVGNAASVIKSFGFQPLPLGDSGPGLPPSMCRKDPNPAL